MIDQGGVLSNYKKHQYYIGNKATMAIRGVILVLSTIMVLVRLDVSIHVHGDHSSTVGPEFPDNGRYGDQMRKLQAFKASSLAGRQYYSASHPPTSISASLSDDAPASSPSPSPSPSVNGGAASGAKVYNVTSYGADSTGTRDSTEAFVKAISDAVDQGRRSSAGELIAGITNLGGAQIFLQGGIYIISRPLRLPNPGLGNLMIHGGTIRASDDFPSDGYLIDLSVNSSLASGGGSNSNIGSYNYELITMKDLMLDSNYRGGGIQVINGLRTSIENCYIVHFTTNGILAQGGHETYIRNSFLGQHITAGGDRGERNFSGTGINLMGNDNGVTDVIIFSAGVGIMISGQANTLSGVHCYNKATGFGGTGVYIKLPGLTQTRIVNSYFDYTGIVAEDPVQLHISSSFFLGDAYIVLKSIKGVVNGVNIVNNMFSGSDKGLDIVQLDQANGAFKEIDQVVIHQNNVKGMKVKATVARASVQGNGTSWTVDLSPTLLFPNLINHVHYTFLLLTTTTTTTTSFPRHALRNISNNRVVIESDVAIPANVFVMADQGISHPIYN